MIKTQKQLRKFNPFQVKGYTPSFLERAYFHNIAKLRELKELRRVMGSNFSASLAKQMKGLYRDCSIIENRLGWVYANK